MPHDASDSPAATDRSEGFGERLLGTMIERAHEMSPQLIARSLPRSSPRSAAAT